MNQSLRKEAWQILITTEAKHTDVKDTSLCVNTIADMLFFFFFPDLQIQWVKIKSLTLFNFQVMSTLGDPVGLRENY